MFIMALTKYFILYFYTYLIFTKAIDFKHTQRRIVFSLIASLILGFVYAVFNKYIAQWAALFISFTLFTVYMKVIINKKFSYTFIVSMISIVISHILFLVSVIFLSLTSRLIFKTSLPTFWDLKIADILTLLLTLLIYKIKKFKKGLAFLKNEEKLSNVGFVLIPLGICAMIIFLVAGRIEYDNANGELLKGYVVALLASTSLLIVVAINRERRNYLRSKLNERTLENFKLMLEEKDKEVKNLEMIAKVNHKINHELSVLKNKYGLKEADLLSDKYSKELKKLKVNKTSSFTNVVEVNDALNYLQSECDNANINFIVKVNGSINYMIEKYISKEKLATLLLDHTKDAIIAIGSSKNSYRSITIILGELDIYYGISIYDTGVEFKINTLVNLGLKPITTYSDKGGTGFGFMTTFDTLNKTNASLVINEKKPKKNDYTKSVSIVFDKKCEYRIISYRASKIKVADKDKRINF